MKFFVILAFALSAVLADDSVNQYVPIFKDYHQEIGIPAAARIKKAEEELGAGGSRIVGGSAAALGQFPHQAGLLITLTSGSISVCGSSLLSNTRLLTAAHCWVHGNSQASFFTVVLGSVTLFSGGTREATNNVEVHANYNQNNLNNDLAMITTNWISYNDNIKPVALPSGFLLFLTFAGNWVTASGFGRTSDSITGGIATTQVLSHVNLYVLTNTDCAATYGPSAVIDSTICTSGLGRAGTCGGDSGGPVIFNNAGESVLVGVVSYGSSLGCEIGYPAGHARVTEFIHWITARM